MIEELISWASDHLVRPEPCFWRTQAGAEVDLLLIHGRRIAPIEIKLGPAVPPRSLAGLKQCMSDLGLKRGYVIHTGDERRSVGSSIKLVPWPAVRQGEIDLSL